MYLLYVDREGCNEPDAPGLLFQPCRVCFMNDSQYGIHTSWNTRKSVSFIPELKPAETRSVNHLRRVTDLRGGQYLTSYQEISQPKTPAMQVLHSTTPRTRP